MVWDYRSLVPHTLVWVYRRTDILGGDSDRVTPVPIPNTVVKPVNVDGTALVRVWESRKPPG